MLSGLIQNQRLYPLDCHTDGEARARMRNTGIAPCIQAVTRDSMGCSVPKTLMLITSDAEKMTVRIRERDVLSLFEPK